MKKLIVATGMMIVLCASVTRGGEIKRIGKPIGGANKKSANLCYNGGFDVPGNPLDGWMIDYAWTGNHFYTGNRSKIHYLSEHAGRRSVMHINGSSGETKVESLPIPYEHGKHYRCTMDYKSTTGPHIYFTGYQWKPGIRPYSDKQIHIGDLRRLYKSQFRNHKERGIGNGWKRTTFEFPLPNPSKLALKHLRYVRVFTVYVVVIADAPGEAWIDKVVVTQID